MRGENETQSMNRQLLPPGGGLENQRHNHGLFIAPIPHYKQSLWKSLQVISVENINTQALLKLRSCFYFKKQILQC